MVQSLLLESTWIVQDFSVDVRGARWVDSKCGDKTGEFVL